MKKIVLGCAAVLLSLGLLAGCNNDEGTVTITVDNAATVVVGESLALPYTVEPEKAKVEVLNDHEEYVTANAKDGVLSLEGIATGDATITLVGTYKKYTEANVDIKVSVVTEGTTETQPGPESGASVTGVFGAPDIPLGEYHYATGENGSNGIATTTEWASAGKITITTSAEGTTISNASGEYLNYTPSTSSTTAVQFESSVYYWGVDSDTGAYIDSVSGDSGRFLGLQSTYTVIRAYAISNLGTDNYGAAVLYSTEPEELETPTPLSFELEEVETPTSGSTYYLGKEVGGVYHLFTGELSGYNLATSTKEDEIVLVTVTVSSDSWTIAVDESNYVYAYSTSEGYADFGVGNTEEISTASGSSSFTWNSTLKTFTSSVTRTANESSYDASYFEYYNGAVALWGYTTSEESSISESSIAHLYQVVDSDEQPDA